MASGYGLSGGMSIHATDLTSAKSWDTLADTYNGLADHITGPSRCFPFWQELLACYVVNTNTDDVTGAKKCVPALEDYYECLHHRKEVMIFGQCALIDAIKIQVH